MAERPAPTTARTPALATRGTPAETVRILTHLLVWIAELSDPAAPELPALRCFPDCPAGS